ncbi:CIC_collapsed_G0011780.mRNA.1.CDS.1 [Saccharomyces cerevisiae]|nr:CIC_collapsed_G0011780.mRNA.1.CDS.1 [Saccharomyces cerevisiae]
MSHSGAAIFEKVSGIIAINEDVSPAELTWRSTDGDKVHTVVLSTIDKLQATPASSEKMMLRLIGKVDESKKRKDNEGNEVVPKPQRHMFSFNNRTVMDNIKMTLQQIISRYKDADIYEEKRRREESAQHTETPMSSSSVTAGTPTPHLDTPQLNNGAPLINTAKLDDSLSKENC